MFSACAVHTNASSFQIAAAAELAGSLLNERQARALLLKC